MNIFIVLITVLVSILAFNNGMLTDRLKFNAYAIKYRKEGWRFISYALVHAGWMHLLINMWVLYSFGEVVERSLINIFGLKGNVYYLLLYLGGILFAVLVDFRKQKENPYYSAVGASGAVSAVVFASILIYPVAGIYLFPIPFAIPAWIFGILYLVYSAYMQKNGRDHVGHSAHLWGAVFGLVFTLIVIPDVMSRFISQLF